MAALHGKNGAIYIDGTKVSFKTEWTLNMGRDYADVTTFRDGNKTYAAGLRDLSGTFAGLLNVDGDSTLTASDGAAHTVAVYAHDDAVLANDIVVASGLAYLDASVTASISDAIRVSGNFRAAGTWTISI